nr:(Fe-S)-binding protein [Cyanobacteria bacterium RUI128]
FIDDEKLNRLKIVDIYSLIEQSGIKFISDKKCSVTYHKPCHTENDSAINIIKNIENIEYTEMDNYDGCCGFGNFEHPQSLGDTKPIRENKKENIKKAKVDILLTTCVGCVISLNIITKFRQKTQRLIEFIRQCKIK